MKLLVIVLLLTFSGITSLFYFLLFSKRAVNRKLKKNVTLPINEIVSSNKSKAQGKLSPIGSPLLSPLTGTPCVWYRVQVEGKYKDLSIEIDEREYVDFEIQDATGKALVNSRNLDVASLESNYGAKNLTDEQQDNIRQFLLSKKAYNDDIFDSKYKTLFMEEWVPVDTEVVIMGRTIKSSQESYKIEFKSDLIKPIYISEKIS